MKSFSKLSWLLCVCLLLFTISSCKKDPPEVTNLDQELADQLAIASGGAGLSYYQFPSENAYGSIPQDPLNPITREKVELGRLLYHETAMGINPRIAEGTGSYSCASCHHAQGGFQAGVKQGIGEGGIGFGNKGEARIPNPNYVTDSLDVQPIRTPSALNIAYQANILWNGQFGATARNMGTEAQWTAGTPKEDNFLGYEGTETQAIAGLKVHRMVVDSNLLSVAPDYAALFAYAFPQIDPQDRIDREYAGLAIAAYERTLLAQEAPFQRWLRGETYAMSDQEKRGAILFFSKANCFSCHNGPALNSMNFYAMGMNNLEGSGIYGSDPNDAAHLGRGGFTGNPADDYKFKVPQLYNLKDSPFFGHGGNFTSVKEVVRYKNEGVAQNSNVPASQLALEFRPLQLTDDEVNDLTAFLEKSLYDPDLGRFLPASLPSGNCFPVNDVLSRIDLGCN